MSTKSTILKCVAFFAVLAAGMPAHANDMDTRDAHDFSINFSLGNIGIGGVFPIEGGGNTFEGSFSLLNFGAEHNRTGFGVWFSPFSAFFWPNWGDRDVGNISLAHLNFYWNVLSHRGVYFGPFGSVNYLFVNDGVHWDRYMLTVGLQGGIRWETSRLNLPAFFVETGFRIIDGTGNFFVSAKIDLLPLLLSSLGRGWLLVVEGSQLLPSGE
ncbi:MAG: hypothetical protein FWB78_01735 [Treponema sp.]|nr:hypothetical protein [Treponema sp.]